MEQLSLVVVSYDSRDDIVRCLASVDAQSMQPHEVIVVDNLPGDGVADFLKASYPRVRIVTSPENLGYAGGNNLGIRAARGEWVLLLNPDTELHEDALLLLTEEAARHPRALITPKLLNPDGTINACGLEMHITGITACRGHGRPADSIRGSHTVPIASGAALLARRSLLVEIGLFDESYFMYMEDVELSLRARARGYQIRCAADAVVTHHHRAVMTPEKFFLLERNRLITLYKTFSPRILRRLAPSLRLTSLATWSYAFLHGQAYLRSRARAGRGAKHALEDLLRDGRQDRIWAGDEELLSGMTEHLPFDQLVGNPRIASALTRLVTPLYRRLAPISREGPS